MHLVLENGYIKEQWDLDCEEMHLGRYRSDLEMQSSSRFTPDHPKSQVILNFGRYIHLKRQ